jgi:predicted RNA binding protein YcfA (HicA-like mRNA interferase family)
MTDVGSHHFVKSKAGSDRVLVPQPSSDPADPLVSPKKASVNFL